MDRFLCTVGLFYLCKTDIPIFSWERKEKGLHYKEKFHFFKKNFHFHALKLFLQSSYLCDTMLFEAIQSPFHSQQKVLVLIGISSPTPTPLFILVPVTLQFAYDLCKRRNFFNVLLRKKGTCLTTSSRLKLPIAAMAATYSSYSLLLSLLQNKESSPI